METELSASIVSCTNKPFDPAKYFFATIYRGNFLRAAVWAKQQEVARRVVEIGNR